MRIPDDLGVPFALAFVPSAKGASGEDCDSVCGEDREGTTWMGRGVLGRPTTTEGLSFTVGEELSIIPLGVPITSPLALFMLPNEPPALLCRMVTGGGGASGT